MDFNSFKKINPNILGSFFAQNPNLILDPELEIYDGGGILQGESTYHIVVKTSALDGKIIIIDSAEIIPKIKGKIQGKLFMSPGGVTEKNYAFSIQKFGLSNANDYEALADALMSMDGVDWVKKDNGQWEPTEKDLRQLEEIKKLGCRPKETIRAEKDKFLLAIKDMTENVKKYCNVEWITADTNPCNWNDVLNYIEPMGRCRALIVGAILNQKTEEYVKLIADATTLASGKEFYSYLEKIINKESFNVILDSGIRTDLSLARKVERSSNPKFMAVKLITLRNAGNDGFHAFIDFGVKEL
ncbi:MAG: hypothetical protein V1865_02415 [bacterium]